MKYYIFFFFFALIFLLHDNAYAAYHFSQFRARTPIHWLKINTPTPRGITPSEIKSAYHLPSRGGNGTVAIIAAYDDSTIEQDLFVFSKTFNLPECSTKNGCFEKHKMRKRIKSDSGWKGETSLDVEWAHAIAPDAKILLVEAATPSGANLLKAIDYASGKKDVVAVSMSWGGAEFSEEVSLDSHFVSTHGVTFFASSGDNGWGASWPAASPYVVGVGGTTLSFSQNGSLEKEKAWEGSGGGISAYEVQPAYQADYEIPKAKHMRAIPDVSYNADPQSGFPVYVGGKGWGTVGGTSAGAPQWAAIKSLGLSASNEKFYADKSSEKNANFFRDITSGTNGDCTYYCKARKHYDYITGLGSPLTTKF